jgi:hypothetical protein
MEQIKGTLLADIYKIFPKLMSPAIIKSYASMPRLASNLNEGQGKFQKPIKDKDGIVYTGCIDQANRKHGMGLMLIPNEGLFEGKFKENVIKGFGRFYKNDTVYECKWRGFNVKGIGKIYYLKDNSEYEGQILDQKPTNYGKLVKKDQWTYEGYFKNGYKDGEGVMTWANFDKYEGSFQNDKQEGKGKFYWSDGSTYNGEWARNKMHGNGVWKYQNQYVYEGQFANGLRQGFGVCVWTNGKRFEGYWMKNKYDGIGTETNEKGEVTTGIWRNGILVNLDEAAAAGLDIVEKRNSLKLNLEVSVDFNNEIIKIKDKNDQKIKDKVIENITKKSESDSYVSSNLKKEKIDSPNKKENDGGKYKFVSIPRKDELEQYKKEIQSKIELANPSQSGSKIIKSNRPDTQFKQPQPLKASKEKNDKYYDNEISLSIKGEDKNDLHMTNPRSSRGVSPEFDNISVIKELETSRMILDAEFYEVFNSGQGKNPTSRNSIASNSAGLKKAAQINAADLNLNSESKKIPIKSPANQNTSKKYSDNTEPPNKIIETPSKFSNQPDEPIKSSNQLPENQFIKRLNLQTQSKKPSDASLNKSYHIPQNIKPIFSVPMQKRQSTIPEEDTLVKPVATTREIAKLLKNLPVFQISYLKFRSLRPFEYFELDGKSDGLHMTDWVEMPKQKIYKGYLNSNDQPQGAGVMLKQGRIYLGTFKNGKKEGLGRLITAIGKIYEGYWRKGKRHGFGVFNSDSEIYCGDWELDTYHGLGTLENTNGVYDGKFIYGVCEGFGILYYKDDKVYKGEFKNGVPDGFGDLKFQSVVEAGRWKHGSHLVPEIAATKQVTPFYDEENNSSERSEKSESSEEASVALETN